MEALNKKGGMQRMRNEKKESVKERTMKDNKNIERNNDNNNNNNNNKGPGGLGIWRTSGDHPNSYIIENGLRRVLET